MWSRRTIQQLVQFAIISVLAALACRRSHEPYPSDANSNSIHPSHSPSPNAQTPTSLAEGSRKGPELWTARFTVVTGLAAVAALVISFQALTMQQQQQREEQERHQLAYAQRVTFWWADAGTDVDVWVQNASQNPISAYIVTLPGDREFQHYWAPMDLAASKRVTAGSIKLPPAVSLGQISPCTVTRLRDPLRQVRRGDKQSGPWVGSLLFTDPIGRIWIRSVGGTLEQVDPLGNDESRLGLYVLKGFGPGGDLPGICRRRER